MSEILTQKNYPEDYPADALRILNAMSFTDGKAVQLSGSMSLRSQQYAGDYDGFESVNMNCKTDACALEMLVRKFKAIVRRLCKMKGIYIGDCKSGAVEEWRIVPMLYKDYDVAKSRAKVKELVEHSILSKSEGEKASLLLKPSKEAYFKAKDELKYHIVRWTIPEILKGRQTLRDGREYTLEMGFGSPSLTKLDVIGFVENNRFTDFSMIYEFKNKGKNLNPDERPLKEGLKEEAEALTKEGNFYKALKREFALAKHDGNLKKVKELSEVFNSDLGRLYVVISDINTLLELLTFSNAPIAKIKFEIDQFKGRLSNVYSLPKFLRKDESVMKSLDAVKSVSDRVKLAGMLGKIESELSKVLQSYSKEAV